MLYPFVREGRALINFCIEYSIPVSASCFGFQMAVLALGGDITRDDKDYEMGTIKINLTDAAKQDQLFHDTPDKFLAVSVHKEKALKAPPGCVLLAATDECAHAFRVIGKPFWAFQFHPEVDKTTLVTRLTFFKEIYTNNDPHLENIIAYLQETPESNKLVRKFIERVLV